MRQPPKIASALLRYFGPLETGTVGDVLEEFQAGKSATWYRRQVISIFCFLILREIRVHSIAVVLCVSSWVGL